MSSTTSRSLQEAPTLPQGPLTALAPPGELVDRRLAIAWNAVTETGVVQALPGTVRELAGRCQVDPGALRSVLELISVWDLVTLDDSGRVELGPTLLEESRAAALAQQGVWIRCWSILVVARTGRPRSRQC